MSKELEKFDASGKHTKSSELDKQSEPPKKFGFLNRWRKNASENKNITDENIKETPQSELEKHREIVEAEIKTLFGRLDEGVANTIGFDGSILKEIYDRRPKRSYESINKEDMDLSLTPYIDGSEFVFRGKDTRRGHSVRYEINCYGGSFTPKIQVTTKNGFLDFSVFTGPTRQEFDSVHIRKVLDDERARTIKTFVSNDGDPYAPNHPLIIAEEILGKDRIQMIYDNIDPDGNVTLLDGQHVYASPSQRFEGRYSAADHSIRSLDSRSAPPVETHGNMFFIDRGTSKQVSFPIQTNIYEQLRTITANTLDLSH